MEFDELITFADMAKQKRSSQIESHVEDPPTPQDGGQLRPRRTIKRKNMREEDDFEFEKSARSPRRKKSRKKQRYTREVQNGWGDDMNEEILFVEKEEFASGSQDFYNRVRNVHFEYFTRSIAKMKIALTATYYFFRRRTTADLGHLDLSHSRPNIDNHPTSSSREKEAKTKLPRATRKNFCIVQEPF